MILNVYPNYFKNEIKELFEEMKELGILHDNAEDIFEMLKKIENNIYSWWSAKPLQNFISKYTKNFAKIENDQKLQKLKRQFKF